MKNNAEAKKLSMSNTKKEMLAAYNEVVARLEEKSKAELKPEKQIEERHANKAVEVAEAASAEGALQQISNLKSEIGKMLSQLSEKLEKEVSEYNAVKEAIHVKDRELREIYDIERSAASLAALIEAQDQKKQEFEAEMSARRKELEDQILENRLRYENEKHQFKTEIEEMKAAEKRRREREKEEYQYSFEREQKLAREMFEDEKTKLEREVQLRSEDIDQREKAIAAKEEELAELRSKLESFPEEKEAAVNEAIKETTERMQAEARNREEFLAKEFEGERNVLKTRIEVLEKTISEQSVQMATLLQQLQKSYGQVEGIALKAVESSANIKPLANLEQLLGEQRRKQSQEK